MVVLTIDHQSCSAIDRTDPSFMHDTVTMRLVQCGKLVAECSAEYPLSSFRIPQYMI